LVSSEGEVKLVDFGVSARLVSNEDKRHTVAGTPYWMAPEVITQQGHDSKADIWSVGITSIELATGRVPHDDISPMKLAVVITQTPPPTLEGKYSADFKHFVSVCLKKNPLEVRRNFTFFLACDFANVFLGSVLLQNNYCNIILLPKPRALCI
jgi:serine/threonine-protein kinase 24/25/MST4